MTPKCQGCLFLEAHGWVDVQCEGSLLYINGGEPYDPSDTPINFVCALYVGRLLRSYTEELRAVDRAEAEIADLWGKLTIALDELQKIGRKAFWSAKQAQRESR